MSLHWRGIVRGGTALGLIIGAMWIASCDGAIVEICNNGKDDDKNGLVDCADGACFALCEAADEPIAMAAETGVFRGCSDGIDNDGDMLVDCNDSDCCDDVSCSDVTFATCAEDGSHGQSCFDGVDNDQNGLVDCEDPVCQANRVECVERGIINCDDGMDNDVDGLVDCADPSCGDILDCVEGPSVNCDDGVDNDLDGLVDCADPGCLASSFLSGCEANEGEVEHGCRDGVDNDGDGLVDCEDPHCLGRADCPETCSNGVVDTDFGEECDDGNLTNGDGCSAMCLQE